MKLFINLNVPLKIQLKGNAKYVTKIIILNGYLKKYNKKALKIIDDFKLNNSTELTTEIFDKLLIDLNKIWKERERKIVGKIKKEFMSEIASLKRQLSSRVPFEEVVANRQITRLKSEIQNANKEAKQNQIAKEKEKMYNLI